MAKSLTAIIYFRQIAVVYFMFDTEVLPMARDVCTLWRWDSGDTATDPFHWRAFVKLILTQLTVHHPAKALDEIADPDHEGICNSNLSRMQMSDIWKMSAKYPSLIWGWAAIAGVFLLPSTLISVTKAWKKAGQRFRGRGESEHDAA